MKRPQWIYPRKKMAENIIIIDGRELPFEAGETILDVARRNGIFIPTLCHLKGAQPTGACRVCVVEIEGGRALAPACSSPAGPNMVVHTNTPAVLEARRTILALLMNSGNHNCSIATGDSAEWTEFERRVESYDQSGELCPAHSACKLQAYAYRYQVDTSGLVRRKTEYPVEMASPLIVRDFSRCILCGRCVDACNTIQVNNAISHGFRGERSKIVAMGDGDLARSECVFCGECIQACPVAALTEKKSRYRIRPWEARHVRTTCHYCGVGCQLDLHIKDDKIMKVTGVEDALPNLGRLCVKGRFGYDFLQSRERLTHPMIRQNGELRRATWDEALDLVAEKIRETNDREGPEAIAGICSAKSTNESLYLMQKLFRSVLGSNQVSSPFAASGLNNPIGEMEKTGCMILIGSDVTEENPVAGTFIKRAAKNGCRLIVVDSGETKISSFAHVFLKVREGSEAVLVNGFIQDLLARGREASQEIRDTAADLDSEKITETTGLSAAQVKEAVDILDSDEPAMLVYGPRVAPYAQTFANLQEILGNLGREFGGVNYLGDLNNSQGACDMGFLPDFLPGYAALVDDEARKPFEDAWGGSLNAAPGPGLSEMVNNMAGIDDGPGRRIRFLYCAGEDLAVAAPSLPNISKALEDVDFLVVQDILENETMKHADVILPASAWAEEDGTYTNCERRVSRIRTAVPAPGEARPGTWIFTELANRLGAGWPNASSLETWEKEISVLVPQLRGITYDRLESGGLQWPVPDQESSGTPHLNGGGPPLCKGTLAPLNYHHRALLEQCEGLLESLPVSGGLGARQPASDPKDVTDIFLKLLEEEEKLEAKEQIDEILRTYRTRMGGLIPVLQQVQGILGFLPVPVQNYIALGLGIPPSDVFGVVTFYSFFTMVPRGRHTIRICLGTACFVKGSARIMETLERHLKIGVGETTADREYSLDVVRCLGACGLAPVMVIDEDTHGQVDPKEVVDIVEGYRTEE
jgi:predicted molibdopterin-dependent oxidoreductase YjgC/NADH:ubiquinone oxidoreductase subunit E